MAHLASKLMADSVQGLDQGASERGAPGTVLSGCGVHHQLESRGLLQLLVGASDYSEPKPSDD